MVKRWEAFYFLTRELIKLTTKNLLRLPNESMVPGVSFLNDLVGPFKIVEKSLHIISSEYPWSDIKFL